MRVAQTLLQQRQPLIRFLGRRTIPEKIDHTPKPHPEASSATLPDSFAQYREKATQHGPLKSSAPSPSSGPQPSAVSSSASAAPAGSDGHPHGIIGGRSARDLGPIRVAQGEFRDRSELPQRFHRTPWSVAEIEAVESGGASMFV